MSVPHLVITSISPPNEVLRTCATGAREAGYRFLVIGDSKSPSEFHLEGCEFFSLGAQRELDFKFAERCPERHYARKNIGYLLAMRERAPLILETDDDNFPEQPFWASRERDLAVPCLEKGGWVNVYRYFTDLNIWPRGLPLHYVLSEVPAFDAIAVRTVQCPIQQGLADENPDVDAIYRLILPLPVRFRSDRRIALASESWCPFNSQNTAWWPEAYPLLYLPSLCSFRMTDIWRSFVAQRVAWENGWSILFHEPTVWQARNDHDLMQDFKEEIPGYLQNGRIAAILGDVSLRGGTSAVLDDLRLCYAALVSAEILPPGELPLLDAWTADCERVL